jgi:hypothetical protein
MGGGRTQDHMPNTAPRSLGPTTLHFLGRDAFLVRTKDALNKFASKCVVCDKMEEKVGDWKI